MFAWMGNLKKIQHGNQNQWGILCDALGKYELSFSIKRSTYFGGLTLKWWKCSATFPISEPYDKICNCRKADQQLALFDMPNLNRFDILSISIFSKIALSISISISIFSKITISISISIFSKITLSISISIFLELP